MASSDSDRDLMEAVKTGDEDAFVELVRRYERPLLNFFFRMSWNREIAEDLVQEVFLRLFRSRTKYLATAKFTTFLFTIANNLWIDRLRSRSRGPGEVSLDATSESDAERSASLKEQILASTEDPHREVEVDEEVERLRAAMDELPLGQKAVLLLGHFQGLRYDDVGAILEIPVGTVKSRMHQAVRKLRETMLDGEAGDAAPADPSVPARRAAERSGAGRKEKH